MLKTMVEPAVPRLVWYVDEEPYQLAEYLYSARLALTPGKHRIQARVAMTPERSHTVEIEVE